MEKDIVFDKLDTIKGRGEAVLDVKIGTAYPASEIMDL